MRSANTTTSRSSGLHPLLVVHLSIETRTLAPPLLEIDSIRERADQKKPMSRLQSHRSEDGRRLGRTEPSVAYLRFREAAARRLPNGTRSLALH